MTSSAFKKIAALAAEDTELAPILYGYIDKEMSPKISRIEVLGGKRERKPDGWFHPSAHPLMTERQLWYYLTKPDSWEKPPFDFTLKMSAKVGSIMHDVVENALKDLGYLAEPKGTCVACGRPQPKECHEHGAIDPETGTRGHMDGILHTKGILRGFEFKTCAPQVLINAPNSDVAFFRKKWPYYYAQVQEYLRMTGMPEYKVLFWGMGNPWEMREYSIHPDHAFHTETRRKYLTVRQMVAEGLAPDACCTPGSKESKACPAILCPFKRH